MTADDASLSDALAVEHSTIYGYGIVSALCPPSVNNLVVEALCALLGRDFAALRLGPESA